MKQFALLTALTLATSGVIAAQQTTPSRDTQPPAPIVRHHAPNAAKETARLAKQLNLTPEQTAKIEPILGDRDAQIAAIASNTTLTDDQRHEQMKEVRKNTQGKLSAVLTPDQQQQMRAMHKHHEENQTPAAPPA